MSWLAGLGAGLSSVGNSMQNFQAEKRAREDRLNAIRDKLSLANAQSPEKRRVVPGKELPPDVAGPPEPEAVETFKTQLKYDPEKGYSAEDTVVGRTANQWTQTGRKVNEEGGKVYVDTTERDLAGNERTRFDESEAAKKLQIKRVLDGDRLVDRVFDEQMNPVRDEGSGPRHKPAAAGRSPEEVRAGIDYRDKLVRERQRESDRLMGDRSIREATARQLTEWRNMSARERGPANVELGLPENATEQQVRNALRLRAKEDYGMPESKPEDTARPAPVPVPESESPFKRKAGDPQAAGKPVDAAARKMITAAKEAGATQEQIEEALIEDGYDPRSL